VTLPTRACLVTSRFPPSPGSAASAAWRLTRVLAAAGIECHVVVPDSNIAAGTPVAPRVVSPNVFVYGLPSGQELKTWIVRLDDMLSFDVFHGLFLHFAFECMAAADRGGRPLIAGIRSHESQLLTSRQPYVHLARATLRRSDWVTYLTLDARNQFGEIVDFESKSSFVPNAVDAAGRVPWQLTDACRGTVGTVSTFRVERGLDTLVRAYAMVPSTLRKSLVLVGDTGRRSGEEVMNDVDAAARECAVERETEITGLLDQSAVANRLAGFHVFVRPSTRDGLSSAVLEAAATGVPIVATAVGGAKDHFRDEESALLVPPDQPARLTAALRAVLEDDDLARRLGEAGTAVARQLSPEREGRTWRGIYARWTKMSIESAE
jgi:glycosyltransferase involved in cell wall biosynthesis